MDIKQLRHFLALARTGSFSRGASQVHLSQPALSRSIQMLEAELGASLLDRIGKKNELTPLGELVAKHAHRVVFEADELRESVRALQAGVFSSLNVGLGSSPGAMLMVPLLSHAARLHPHARMVVTRGSTEMHLARLRSRHLDALIVDTSSVLPAPDLRVELLVELPAGFMCRAGHPLAKNVRITFDELLGYPIAAGPISEGTTRVLVDTYGPAANPASAIRLTCDEVSGLIQLALHSDAIFFGIQATARSALDAGQLVVMPVDPGLNLCGRYALVTLVGRTEGSGVALLREFCERIGRGAPALNQEP